MSEERKTEIINYEAGLERFYGRTELYLKYVKLFVKGDDQQKLIEAMDAEDYQTAFRISHNMKSAIGNLSFDRLYSRICELTECLRDEKDIQRGIALMPILQEEYTELIEELKKRELYR